MTDEKELFEEEKAIQGPTIDINKEMRASYLEYAMSVIVGRALPDVRRAHVPPARQAAGSLSAHLPARLGQGALRAAAPR